MRLPKLKKKFVIRMTRVVRIEVGGRWVGDHRARADDGVIGDFLKWICKQDFSPVLTRMVGAGLYVGLFWPEDADKVLDWLKQRLRGVPKETFELVKGSET